MAILGFEIDSCRRDFVEKLNTVLKEKNNHFPLISLNLKDDPIESKEVCLENLINQKRTGPSIWQNKFWSSYG